MELLTGIFSAFGLSASAGLNAYIPLLVIGAIDHYTNWLTLKTPWDTLSNPWILLLLSILVIIEMIADKIPAVNHANDVIQTLVRPVAGALAFAAATNTVTGVNPTLALALGLFVAGSVHAVKAVVVRPVVSATTGGLANAPVSIAEDVTSTVVSVLAIIAPIIVGTLLIITLAFLLSWWWGGSNPETQ